MRDEAGSPRDSGGPSRLGDPGATDPLDGLDVPVRPVDRSSAGGRRAVVAAIAVIAILGGAIGLAMRGRDVDPVAIAPAPTSSRPTPLASPEPGVLQALPEIENVPLPNAPTPAFIVRVGHDAEVHAWTAGEPTLEVARAFPNAYEPGAEDQHVTLSPDGRFASSFRVRPSDTAGSDRVRLLTADGISWERDGVTADTGIIWWGDGERLALIGDANTVVLGEVDAAGRVAEREIEIDPAALGEVEPSLSPSASVAVEGSRFAPIGFSVDGRAVPVAQFNDATRTSEPAYRIDVEEGIASPLVAFPTAGPSGLSPEGSEFGFVDPARGRALRFPDYSGDEPGPITVLEADGEVAYDLESRWPAGLWWDVTGRLILLEQLDIAGPSGYRLRSIHGDGVPTVLLETPPLARAALIGVRDGYAALALQVDDPRRSQLLLVDLDDGAASAIEAGQLGVNGPDGAGWVR